MSGGLSYEGGGIGRRLPQYMIARSAYYAQVCLPKPPTRQRQHARATAHMHAPALELHFADGSSLALAFELGTGILWSSNRAVPTWEWTRCGRRQPATSVHASARARTRGSVRVHRRKWSFGTAHLQVGLDDAEPFFIIDPIEGAI